MRTVIARRLLQREPRPIWALEAQGGYPEPILQMEKVQITVLSITRWLHGGTLLYQEVQRRSFPLQNVPTVVVTAQVAYRKALQQSGRKWVNYRLPLTRPPGLRDDPWKCRSTFHQLLAVSLVSQRDHPGVDLFSNEVVEAIKPYWKPLIKIHFLRIRQ